MLDWGLTFHHLGLAVHSPEVARVYLGGLGYQFKDPLYDPLQQVNVQIAEHLSQPCIELVWPGETSGPLDSILKGQQGVVYHTCYSATDPEQSLELMAQQGLRVMTVSPAKPAILFNGKLVSFHMVRGVGLIEILHDV